MISVLSIIAIIISAIAVYRLMFDDLKDLTEQAILLITFGTGRDNRIFVLIFSPLVVGLLIFISLSHLMGKPIYIPFF